ncbi:MAG: twin-arginine translocase TatA/TatE family subunit [Candidatus Hydrogenedens sp.]|nr:twin-arginine translocase TatA/TatE family subunit [Candidatus Hydrogenedens sp.]
MPGATELIIILVIVLVVFGGSRVAGLGKSLGEGISEFKKAVKGEDEKGAAPKSDTSEQNQ